MAKKNIEEKSSTEFIRIFEDKDVKSIWTYDYSKNPFGPISTEFIDKNEPEIVVKKKTKKKTK